MPKARERGFIACNHCRRQKVKCSGDQPCQRCLSRSRDCKYSSQDPVVSVSESYLKHLDSTLDDLASIVRRRERESSRSESENREQTEETLPNVQPARNLPESLVDGSTAESILRKLKYLPFTGSNLNMVIDASTGAPSVAPTSASSTRRSDVSDPSRGQPSIFSQRPSFPSFDLKFPPYPYAIQLIEIANREFADYHTFLRKTFRRRFHATYEDPHSQAWDLNWLCRLSFVLALAEACTTKSKSLSITVGGTGTYNLRHVPILSSPPTIETQPPGLEYFEQGLRLLQAPYEEATVTDVEALNLASHFCYILNRPRSAYSYAGQAIRLAYSLGLNQPSPASVSTIEKEHRKRVWWTAFCIDRVTSAELGLRPFYTGTTEDLEYPTSNALSTEENEEFFDPELLTAHINLCEIKTDVVTTVSQLKSKDVDRPYEILGQCLERLNAWRKSLPPAFFSRFGSTEHMTTSPESRLLSSISLRYHQCYILLLRPLLLHQLAFILRDDVVISLKDEIHTVNDIGVQAAIANAKTLINLAELGKIVIYGYWDSVHLFSCLTILSVVQLIASRQPEAFEWNMHNGVDNDLMITYKKARGILESMAQAGNAPSKHHLKMLEEIESIEVAMSERVAEQSTGPASWNWTGADPPPSLLGSTVDAHGSQNVGKSIEREVGFDDWPELLRYQDTGSSTFRFSQSPLS